MTYGAGCQRSRRRLAVTKTADANKVIKRRPRGANEKPQLTSMTLERTREIVDRYADFVFIRRAREEESRRSGPFVQRLHRRTVLCRRFIAVFGRQGFSLICILTTESKVSIRQVANELRRRHRRRCQHSRRRGHRTGVARGTSYLGIFHQTQFGVGNVQLVAFAGLDAAHVEIEMHRTRRRPQIVVRVFGHVTCKRQT